jgi:hypothetical protein
MSSNESISSSTPSPEPAGKPRGSTGMVALSLVLLAGLVWAMGPGRARFVPAPLRPLPAGCPQAAPDFVPSDATEIPGVDLSALSSAQKNHLLFRLNMEPCPCGCNASIAACRIGHHACPVCKDLVEKMVAEETGGERQETGVRSQEAGGRRQESGGRSPQ